MPVLPSYRNQSIDLLYKLINKHCQAFSVAREVLFFRKTCSNNTPFIQNCKCLTIDEVVPLLSMKRNKQPLKAKILRNLSNLRASKKYNVFFLPKLEKDENM